MMLQKLTLLWMLPEKGKKRKIGKLVPKERKENGKKKKRRAPKVQKLGSPEAHGEKP
jgi:hypothetical protein